MTMNVLIVDDSPADREMVRAALANISDADYRVTDAEDGEGCLSRLGIFSDIDCILLDYSMPGLDGLGVLKEIRQLDASLPVVMLTGSNDGWVLAKATEVGADGWLTKSTDMTAALHDAIVSATEAHRMQKQFLDRKAEQDAVFRILLHDLAAPIRTIDWYSQRLIRSEQEGDASNLQTGLHAIQRGARQIDSLVRAMSFYFSIPTSYSDLESVNLSVLAHASLQRFDLGRVSVGGDFPTVLANHVALSVVFQHLIENGLLYNKSDDPSVRITSTYDKEGASILFEDNGLGIDPDYQEVIFQPCRRLFSYSDYKGSGFGLAIGRKIVEAHGGRLICAASGKDGSVFEITLPRNRLQ